METRVYLHLLSKEMLYKGQNFTFIFHSLILPYLILYSVWMGIGFRIHYLHNSKYQSSQQVDIELWM